LARLELEKGLVFVEDDDAGQRLDRFLAQQLAASRSLIEKLIRKGNVRINRKRTRPNARLRAGDCIFVPVSLRTPRPSAALEDPPPELLARIASLTPLAEERRWLALNKPAGIPVHGGSQHRWGLIELLRVQRNEPELRLVHRLDRDTTGVLLIARGPRAARELGRAFAARTAKKTYLALTLGTPPEPEGVAFSRLRKGILQGGERIVQVHEGGKPAQMRWRTIGVWPLAMDDAAARCALIALFPESGRTHQLRVQLAALGAPILGDAKYGHRESVRLWRAIGAAGIALHAWRLQLSLPEGECIELQAPLPKDWRAIRRYWA